MSFQRYQVTDGVEGMRGVESEGQRGSRPKRSLRAAFVKVTQAPLDVVYVRKNIRTLKAPPMLGGDEFTHLTVYPTR